MAWCSAAVTAMVAIQPKASHRVPVAKLKWCGSHTGGTSRRQQETDDLFAAGYARAQAADLAEGAMP